MEWNGILHAYNTRDDGMRKRKYDMVHVRSKLNEKEREREEERERDLNGHDNKKNQIKSLRKKKERRKIKLLIKKSL